MGGQRLLTRLAWVILCVFASVTTIHCYKPKNFGVSKPKEINFAEDESKTSDDLDNPPVFSGNSNDTGCGRTLKNLKNGYASIIESPNYPNGYPANADCVWDLEAAPGNIIQATFFDVRIKSPSLIGPSDSLYVTTDGDWGEMQRYSGDLNGVTPFNLLSSSRRMAFRFKSTPTSTGGKGFRIGYYVSHREKPTSAETTSDALKGLCNKRSVDIQNTFSPKLTTSKAKESYIKEQYKALKKLKRTNPNPYLVALVLDDEHFCSGALIRDNFVVTSAHCTQNVERIDMIFGTDDITIQDAGVQRRTEGSSSVYKHPYFDDQTGYNDLSLVRLSEPVLFTKYVKAARLPSLSLLGRVFAGHKVQIDGWGADAQNDGNVFAKSSSTEFLVTPNAACRTSLHKNLNGLMMCSKGQPRNRFCQADTGSPLVARCVRTGEETVEDEADYDDSDDAGESDDSDSSDAGESDSDDGDYSDDSDDDDSDDYSDDLEASGLLTQNRNLLVKRNNLMQKRIDKVCPKCAKNKPEDFCYFHYHFAEINNEKRNGTRSEDKRKHQGLTSEEKGRDSRRTMKGGKIQLQRRSDKGPQKGCEGYGSSDVLLGIVSFGSCSKGFVFSRMTAYLDFLSTTITTH